MTYGKISREFLSYFSPHFLSRILKRDDNFRPIKNKHISLNNHAFKSPFDITVPLLFEFFAPFFYRRIFTSRAAAVRSYLSVAYGLLGFFLEDHRCLNFVCLEFVVA